MAKMNYGMPYKGSKNSIAEWVIENLPAANTLYDLCGGGGAITHCALLSGKYNHVVYNELQKPIAELFLRAVKGDLAKETRWVSRECFNENKDKDGYIASCWSFGNGLKTYMYAKEIEPWKKASHYAIVFEDYTLFNKMDIDITLCALSIHERRLEFRQLVNKNKAEYKEKYIKWYLESVMQIDVDYTELKKNLEQKIKVNKEELREYLIKAKNDAGLKNSDIDKYLGTQMSGHYFGKSQWAFPTEEEYNKLRKIMPTLKDYYEVRGYSSLCESVESLQRLESLQSLQRLESLESLERLERLQSLERLERLTILNASYDEVTINNNSIIYCDIPYKGTSEYTDKIFNHDAFYEWCCKQSVPVYVSEYNMPEDRFEVVAEREKRVLLASDNRAKAIEKIFRVKRG